MALREARHTRVRGMVMLFSMVFGLTVLVSFSSIKEGFQESFYNISSVLTGGDLRVEVIGKPTERLQRLLPRLGDTRSAYWGLPMSWEEANRRKTATVWLLDLEATPLTNVDKIVETQLPDTMAIDIALDESQWEALSSKPVRIPNEALGNHWSPNWKKEEGELLPPWMKRIKRDSKDRWVGSVQMLHRLTRGQEIAWEQIWTFQVDGADSLEREARSKYILEYLKEESQGVTLIHELPTETGFYQSFILISNTLFLAAFSALMLGTLAYTVTFVDFSRGKSDHVALLRCLGAGKSQAWGVHGIQVLAYVVLSVLLAGVFSVAIQWYLPKFINALTSVDMEVQIYWRSLLISLGFGGCFILLPGMIAIMPLVSCEPVEVLRSVKMPTRRKEYGWIQVMLIACAIVLALAFCLQMVDDRIFALIFLLCMLLVFGGLLGGVNVLRKTIKRITSRYRNYEMDQAASNLFREQNHYVFTLSSIAFGLFLITFLYQFFEGFANRGIFEIAGYGSISDERVTLYLGWLKNVFFINQWIGVTLLLIGVLAVFVLLTAQRQTRIYEAVILATLGATSEVIRKILAWESLFAGMIVSILGPIGGWLVGLVVFKVFFGHQPGFPFMLMLGLMCGTILIMVAMGIANMKGVVGVPPLEVLRKRRHFSNW